MSITFAASLNNPVSSTTCVSNHCPYPECPRRLFRIGSNRQQSPHIHIHCRLVLLQQSAQDKSEGQLLYLPREGEDMSTATAMIAVEETLVQHNASARHVWHGWVQFTEDIITHARSHTIALPLVGCPLTMRMNYHALQSHVRVRHMAPSDARRRVRSHNLRRRLMHRHANTRYCFVATSRSSLALAASARWASKTRSDRPTT